MKQFLLLLCATVLLLSSCSDKLSRRKAESLIKDKYHFPFGENTTILKHYITDEQGTDIYNALQWGEKEKLEILKSMGLIELTKEHKSETGAFSTNSWINVTISLTEKGRKYFVRDEQFDKMVILLYEIEFNEISGMLESEQPVKSAVVSYTCNRIDPSPFNDVFKEDMNKKDQFSVKVVKYDDGWRIE